MQACSDEPFTMETHFGSLQNIFKISKQALLI